MSEGEATTSANEAASTNNPEDCIVEPEAKRRKPNISDDLKKNKLEDRLGGIFCCAVCLDLPTAAVYQCSNGHLMCAECFTHLLADARLRDETATCPSCRIEISKTSAIRNLAVEKAVSELPSECNFCNKQFERNFLEKHREECEERIAGCKYQRIGCPWRGPDHERPRHESECAHPHKSGAEVMHTLQILDQQLVDEQKRSKAILELLNYDRITFNDIQLKPYRTDEFVNRLFYESPRFSAFNNQWLLKGKINNTQKDPTHSIEREMTYQLILKSKTTTPMDLSYFVIRGPTSDIKVKPIVHNFEFKEEAYETAYVRLPLPDAAECNRLLSAATINFRLVMVLASK